MIKVNTLANECVIKEGQTVFGFVCGLPNAEDYGVSALPNLDNTIWLVEKQAKVSNSNSELHALRMEDYSI